MTGILLNKKAKFLLGFSIFIHNLYCYFYVGFCKLFDCQLKNCNKMQLVRNLCCYKQNLIFNNANEIVFLLRMFSLLVHVIVSFVVN
jgi:hypothetical protein